MKYFFTLFLSLSATLSLLAQETFSKEGVVFLAYAEGGVWTFAAQSVPAWADKDPDHNTGWWSTASSSPCFKVEVEATTVSIYRDSSAAGYLLVLKLGDYGSVSPNFVLRAFFERARNLRHFKKLLKQEEPRLPEGVSQYSYYYRDNDRGKGVVTVVISYAVTTFPKALNQLEGRETWPLIHGSKKGVITKKVTLGEVDIVVVGGRDSTPQEIARSLALHLPYGIEKKAPDLIRTLYRKKTIKGLRQAFDKIMKE